MGVAKLQITLDRKRRVTKAIDYRAKMIFAVFDVSFGPHIQFRAEKFCINTIIIINNLVDVLKLAVVDEFTPSSTIEVALLI
jgi:hypothetical protein